MSKFTERIRKWRSQIWKALTVNDEVTWMAHLMLVVFGSLLPGILAALVWSSLTVGVVIGFLFSELWLLFMSGREVVDYFKHKKAGDEPKVFIRDGIGDLVGPLINHLLWWGGLIAVIVYGG